MLLICVLSYCTDLVLRGNAWLGTEVGEHLAPKRFPRCLNWRTKRGKCTKLISILDFVAKNWVISSILLILFFNYNVVFFTILGSECSIH